MSTSFISQVVVIPNGDGNRSKALIGAMGSPSTGNPAQARSRLTTQTGGQSCAGGVYTAAAPGRVLGTTPTPAV